MATRMYVEHAMRAAVVLAPVQPVAMVNTARSLRSVMMGTRTNADSVMPAAPAMASSRSVAMAASSAQKSAMMATQTLVMGVLQTILNVVDFSMPVQEAVLAPRFSATSDNVVVTARIPRYAYAELERQGYRFVRSPYSYQIASVHAISFDAHGQPSGGADIPYGDGMALRVD